MTRQLSPARFWFINVCILVLFLVLAYQIFQLTVIRQPSLTEAAKRQHHLTVTIPPLRGAILDRNGRELAANLKLPSLYGIPRILDAEEREKLETMLSGTLNLDRTFLRERLSRDKAFVWLKRKVSLDEASKLAQIKHPALGVLEEYKRFYPQGSLLSQVLGFTNVDNAGLEGVELFLNHELQGQQGRRYTKRDALGREIRAFDMKTIPAVNGNRVVLTIDQYLQYLTERALDRAYREHKAKGAMALIMNPHTGEILAMANRPTYDLNEAGKSTPENRRNRVLTDVYEPGSIFKIVAASAVLNEKVATPETLFFCENGRYHYGIKTLRDVKPYGNLSLTDVIVKSSNIGTVKMAALLKPAVFQNYIRDFGFGQKTGIDFPGEVSGFTRPPAQWSKTSPYNIPMGHEVLVTTVQMARAFSVIANGGFLVKPYLIARIEDQHGIVLKQNQPEVVRQVVRPEVAEQVTQILMEVVEQGTGKKAQINGISVAGKTGTAQKVLSGGRGYSNSNFISSFVGFAPADDPKLVMAVILDDPKPRYYGGTVAAPVFKEVIEPALLYLRYLPENPERGASRFAPLSGTQENQPMLPSMPAPGRGV